MIRTLARELQDGERYIYTNSIRHHLGKMKHFLKSRLIQLSLALASCLWAVPSAAVEGASSWVKTDQTEIRLVSASSTVGSSDTLQLGLQFRLRPEWKIYWRSPGDAGFPPQLDWSASTNVTGAKVSWPVPTRFSVLGLETLGYKDEVVLPIELEPETPGTAVRAEARLRYLTCNEICIPYDAVLSLDLPSGTQSPSEYAHLINRFRSTVPGRAETHGLQFSALQAEEAGDMATLHLSLTSDLPLSAPDVFVEGPRELAFSQPEFSLSADRHAADISISAEGLGYLEDETGKTLEGRQLTLTFVDGDRSVEQSLTVGEPLAPLASRPLAATSPSEVSFLTILVFAVLGGLILNFMPCVLPVLSLKVLGVVGHGGGETGRVRLSFLASASGIIFSFLVLAGVLAAFKTAGVSIGWGVQFQHPWFLISLVFVVTLFACNLWGLFEVRLPSFLSRVGTPSQQQDHMAGHFMQGALATLLATPCSAPFLGTAIGFALARGTAEILVIFLALGVGLALPFLLFAAAPRLVTRLPRPGAWMLRLRFVLGVALAATGAWLISILEPSVGARGAGIVVAAMVTIVGLLYFCKKAGNGIGPANWATILGVFVLAVFAPAHLASPTPPTTASTQSNAGPIHWQTFDPAAIPGLVRNGHTVLVDVTADWCITCKVNKALVFGDGEIARILERPKFVAMQADWTLPSDDIANYLAGFGRYGIPFNAVYGPNNPQGAALPELLSEGIVITALTSASGQSALAKQTK